MKPLVTLPTIPGYQITTNISLLLVGSNRERGGQLMKNKLLWIFAVILFSGNALLQDVNAKQVINLKIGNINLGEESVSIETDKGEYILPSHFSGMLDEETFTKLFELIQTNKGKTFPFIVEESDEYRYIVGIEEEPLQNKKAQLDLEKLLDNRHKPKLADKTISKEYYLNYIKEQILYGKEIPILDIISDEIGDKYPVPEKYIETFGGQSFGSSSAIIRDILKNEYNTSIPDECRTEGVSCYEIIFKWIYTVMNDLSHYYYRTIIYKDSGESEKERLTHNIDQLKSVTSKKEKIWGGVNDSLKVMKFINDYNNLLASAYTEANYKSGEKKKAQEEQKLIEEQKARDEIKEKIDPIINYANSNRNQLEKESKSLCKDLSGLWIAEGEYLTVDLVSSDKIIEIGNERPLDVQIGKFDKEQNSLIVYIAEDGKISIGENGTPVGLVFRKVKTGGNEFKLGMSMTDGIKIGQETIFGWVKELE